MTYSKPEVNLLGTGRTMIEYLGSAKFAPLADGTIPHPPTATTAYDLDE